ncbi:hypothetical protein WME95_43850 [Sorangium sp. So ce327]|uniref:hypothetical protein n=1 Tax=Sorangium sp. So ce327 TaxID=3133301 RepID=UPI003F622061
MVTPDEIERLNADDNDILTKIESSIDAELKSNRGEYDQRMWTGWKELLGDKKIDKRIWSELARRYAKAGWVVSIRHHGGNALGSLIIQHPLIAFPNESYR